MAQDACPDPGRRPAAPPKRFMDGTRHSFGQSKQLACRLKTTRRGLGLAGRYPRRADSSFPSPRAPIGSTLHAHGEDRKLLSISVRTATSLRIRRTARIGTASSMRCAKSSDGLQVLVPTSAFPESRQQPLPRHPGSRLACISAPAAPLLDFDLPRTGDRGTHPLATPISNPS